MFCNVDIEGMIFETFDMYKKYLDSDFDEIYHQKIYDKLRIIEKELNNYLTKCFCFDSEQDKISYKELTERIYMELTENHNSNFNIILDGCLYDSEYEFETIKLTNYEVLLLNNLAVLIKNFEMNDSLMLLYENKLIIDHYDDFIE